MQRKIEKLGIPICESEYYTVLDLEADLSYGADYTVLTSVRNVGKSYSAMCHALNLVREGKTVLWERYNKDEFKLSLNTWMNFAPDLAVCKSGLKTLIDETSGGKIILIQTSTANNIKGFDDDFDKLPVLEVKDEFLPIRYTNNTRFIHEYSEAMEIRKTFKRNGEMRSLYLGNNLNWLNPYTVGWNMPMVGNGERIKVTDTFSMKNDEFDLSAQRTILWHSIKPTQRMMSRIFKQEIASMNKSDLEDYFQNQFYQEYQAIAKCPNLKTPLQSFELMSDGYYMGIRVYDGKYYFARVNHNKTCEVYVSEPEYIDFETNHLRIKSVGLEFQTYFNNGLCIFDSMNTYYAFFRWIVNLRKSL
jgi:hypothetical protein